MDAVGPYFPIDMTQDCLILLSLSKKRPKNNLLRRVACSRRGSSMQIRKTQFFLRHPVSFCTRSLFRSHSHLPVPLWSQSFLIINPTQPTCTAGLLPDRAEVVRETFCKITSASTKVAIIPSISSTKKTKRIHPLGFALSNVHYFCLTDIFDLIRDEI